MNETPTPNIESTLEKALIDSIDGIKKTGTELVDALYQLEILVNDIKSRPTSEISADVNLIDGAFNCSQARYRAGLPYPRTCSACQLGPCKYPDTMLAKT